MVPRVAVCLLVIVLGTPGFSLDLTIYTNDNPPMQYVGADFQIHGGLGIEIVSEIQRRIGDTSPIQGVPWTRGYKAVRSEPNVLLFSMARTPEREKLVRWVGPLFVNKSILVTRKADRIKLSSLEDAKKLRSIGTVTDDVRGQLLKAGGFTNLEPVHDYASNIKKLALGRVEAVTSSSFSFYPVIREAGLDPADFEAALAYGETQVYLAFSLRTPDAVVEKWSQTLDAMARDGTLKRIVGKYAPE